MILRFNRIIFCIGWHESTGDPGEWRQRCGPGLEREEVSRKEEPSKTQKLHTVVHALRFEHPFSSTQHTVRPEPVIQSLRDLTHVDFSAFPESPSGNCNSPYNVACDNLSHSCQTKEDLRWSQRRPRCSTRSESALGKWQREWVWNVWETHCESTKEAAT